MKPVLLIIFFYMLTGCTSTPVEDMPMNNQPDKLTQFTNCSSLIGAGQTNQHIAESRQYKECINP